MKRILMLLTVALLIAGCKSTDAEKKVEKHNLGKITATEAVELQKKAGVYAGEMIQAMEKNDYKNFVKYLLPSFRKKNLNKDTFKKFCDAIKKNMGDCESHEYLTSLDKEPWMEFLFKCRFSRTVTKDKKEKVIKRYALFRLGVAKIDGKFQVIGFSFLPL